MVPVWMILTLEWPLTHISRSWYHSTSNNSKMVPDRAIFTIADQESVVWSIERRHFQRLWTIPTPSFKVTPFFDAEYFRNGTTYRYSVIEILITVASPDPRGWGAEVRGSGGRSGVQGQSPGEGLGAKLPEADAYTQIYIYTHTHIFVY